MIARSFVRKRPWPLGASALVVAAAVAACLGVDRPTQVTFQGVRYYGVAPTLTNVSADDIEAVGQGVDVNADTVDATVYALEGVAPQRAVAMRLDDRAIQIFVRARDDGLHGPADPAGIAGLCRYFRGEC